MTPRRYPAYRFDGRIAAADLVWVQVSGGTLVAETEEGREVERQRVDAAMACEPFRHAPRIILLRSGATLEIADGDQGFLAALQRSGVQPSFVVRHRQHWLAALTGAAALLALLVFIYVEWLPRLANQVAVALPPGLEARMGSEVMAALDRHYLQPSNLGEVQRTRIAERFATAAAAAAPGTVYRLEFRSAGDNVPNAAALPGGIIVMFDGLVDLADSDERVLAVLGHELGHVVHRHSARQIVQSVGIGALASLLWGDFSAMAVSMPLALGMLHYSRDFEREADAFAVSFLRAQGLSARPLHEFFSRVRDYEAEHRAGQVPAFLSSHPPTEERLRFLEQDLQDDLEGSAPAPAAE